MAFTRCNDCGAHWTGITQPQCPVCKGVLGHLTSDDSYTSALQVFPSHGMPAGVNGRDAVGRQYAWCFYHHQSGHVQLPGCRKTRPFPHRNIAAHLAVPWTITPDAVIRGNKNWPPTDLPQLFALLSGLGNWFCIASDFIEDRDFMMRAAYAHLQGIFHEDSTRAWYNFMVRAAELADELVSAVSDLEDKIYLRLIQIPLADQMTAEGFPMNQGSVYCFQDFARYLAQVPNDRLPGLNPTSLGHIMATFYAVIQGKSFEYRVLGEQLKRRAEHYRSLDDTPELANAYGLLRNLMPRFNLTQPLHIIEWPVLVGRLL